MEEQIYLTEELQELPLTEGEQIPVVLFNGPICTATGLYRLSDLDFDEARFLVRFYGFESAVGHESSAEVLSSVLGVDVPMNRVDYVQRIGQKAIVLKLNKRPEEGRILNTAEIYAVGFCLQLLERLN
ncbi:MAG: DUF1874 domain-containing protein [Firmicutes bacterium]|nr:DUF1874 domain-containing protein [Bacillota bacterium]